MLATWGCATFPKPTLDLQFAGATSLDSRITFTRGSQATLFNSAGTLVFAPNNLIRNNMMVGAVAGTPGTLPTNWTASSIGGVSLTQVVGTGTENGITYIDVRFAGTTSSTAAGGITTDGTTQIAALLGQTWASSFYIRLVGGSTSGITNISNTIQERDAGGVLLIATNTTVSPTGAALNTQRVATTRTLNNASTAFVNQQVRITPQSGVAIDITLRIGMPQLERGSVATEVNATSGTAYYGPRFDYDPSTLAARGLLIEEARTNSIRNNTMQGAVAGTPGTLPTNWVALATAGGLTREIVGIGTVDGIPYIDIRYSGTTTDANSVNLAFDGNSAIAASNGQTWTSSSYVTVVGGNFTNITSAVVRVTERTGAGSFVGSTDVSFASASGALRLNRFSATRTLGATAGAVQGNVFLTIASGVAIDITLRIGLPQLEQGAFATSVIPTTTTALTRNADVASMTGTNFSSWYNASEGTLFGEAFVHTAPNNANIPCILSFDDGTANNRIQIYRANSNAVPNLGFVVVSGGSTSTVRTTASTQSQPGKIAGAYKVDDFAASGNGSTPSTDTTGTVPTVTQAQIGNGTGSGLVNLNGWIARITYYPSRLPNTTLQALTA